jgi:hypothetical protein
VPFKPDDIVRISYAVQKRNGSVTYLGADLSSYCACSRHGPGRRCAGNLKKGEQIIKVRYSFLTTQEGKRWFKNERWRPACYQWWFLSIGHEHRIHMELEEHRAKLRARLEEDAKYVPLKDQFEHMSDQQFTDYQALRQRWFSHQHRLRKYQARRNPTDQTLAAIKHQTLVCAELEARIVEYEIVSQEAAV